jgi:hypothetical protein
MIMIDHCPGWHPWLLVADSIAAEILKLLESRSHNLAVRSGLNVT